MFESPVQIFLPPHPLIPALFVHGNLHGAVSLPPPAFCVVAVGNDVEPDAHVSVKK